MKPFLYLLPLILLSFPAQADPCEALPPSSPGITISGQVTHVIDGDSLCIGSSNNPAEWVEIRLGDYDAKEYYAEGGRQARNALAGLVLRKEVICETVLGRSGRVISFDRAIAVCKIDGQSLGNILRLNGGKEGGR